MTILALDACGRFVVSAVFGEGGSATYAVSEAGIGAVRAVYSSVDRALERAGLTPGEIGAIVVNTGPGSWTATRIAVTYAAALAYGAAIPAYGYSGFALGAGMGGVVAFRDQLGKLVIEKGDEPSEARVIELFPDVSAEDFLSARRTWLDHMLKLGGDALEAGGAGDPLELRTTYFQEFLAGVRH